MYFFHLSLHVLFLFYLYAYVSYTCMQSIISVSHKDVLMSFISEIQVVKVFLTIDSLLAKFFKSLCYDRFYCIQQVNMSWVICDFSHMFICLLWFFHELTKWEIIRTYVIHLLGTYITSLCNWLILWQNAFYLYFGRSRMCLILQETLFQDQMLKSCKSIQDSSAESDVH